MSMNYIEISKEEAKKLYCYGENIYITNGKRTFWRLPSPDAYGSHAPAEQLFHRSIPFYEGDTKFYKAA